MFIRNSKTKYSDSPDCRVLDLAKVGIPDVPVLSFIRYTRRQAPVDPHCHKGCFEIGLCLRGYFVLENNRAQHTILAGDVFINAPDAAHRMLDYPKGTVLYVMMLRTENSKGRFLRFNRAESDEIRARLRQLPARLNSTAVPLKHDFIEMFRAYDMFQGRYRTVCMTASCMSLVTDLLKSFRTNPEPSHSDRLTAIITLMRQSPDQPYNIDILAHQAALSPSHFINQFKSLTGLPPHHFLLMCRIEEAKKRLRDTRFPVTRIAHDLGFCSSQHFGSHFKRATGLSPLAWRKR